MNSYDIIVLRNQIIKGSPNEHTVSIHELNIFLYSLDVFMRDDTFCTLRWLVVINSKIKAYIG